MIDSRISELGLPGLEGNIFEIILISILTNIKNLFLY